jgi:hypothetical protein
MNKKPTKLLAEQIQQEYANRANDDAMRRGSHRIGIMTINR